MVDIDGDVVRFCKEALPENAEAFADPRLELVLTFHLPSWFSCFSLLAIGRLVFLPPSCAYTHALSAFPVVVACSSLALSVLAVC